MCILISETNSRPAVASEIKPGDLWITAIEMDNRDGMAHGRRVDTNVPHPRDESKIVICYNHSRTSLDRNAPVRIWTGGSARTRPANGEEHIWPDDLKDMFTI